MIDEALEIHSDRPKMHLGSSAVPLTSVLWYVYFASKIYSMAKAPLQLKHATTISTDHLPRHPSSTSYCLFALVTVPNSDTLTLHGVLRQEHKVQGGF